MNAITLIPKFYRTQQIDSLQKVVDVWKRYCNGIDEIKYTEILLDIERATFSETQVNNTLIQLLDGYAASYAYDSARVVYHVPFSGYYKISSAWAKLLLARPSLTKTEIFICNVFAGNIKNPEKEIRRHREEYPLFHALLNKDLLPGRKAGGPEYTLVSGIWIPTGHLSILGAHPSIGIQLGGRSKMHQIDLTMQLRFVNSPGPYSVKRADSLYSLKHYFGGYIGLDYNYYFISRTNTDFGILGGIGFDGFDIAGSDDDKSNDYMKPTSINSLNLNTGLRFNYIFSARFYLGLQARYNFINYNNNGGSSLHGGGVSIDLIIANTGRSRRRGMPMSVI